MTNNEVKSFNGRYIRKLNYELYFAKAYLLIYYNLSPMQISLFFFLNLFIYLFIFGCVGSLLLHVGFLQLRQAGATLGCGVQPSHCGGFSRCAAWAQLLHSVWDPPGPRLEPVSPPLAGGFLTTAPPGNSADISYIILVGQVISFNLEQKLFQGLAYIPCPCSSRWYVLTVKPRVSIRLLYLMILLL